MAGIKDYSTTQASNTSLNGISVAEGMLPSNLNNAIRALMKNTREWFNDSQWVEYGDGDGAYTATYASGTSFTISGVDVTAIYHTNRRIKITATTPGTIYGTISSSSFSTNTTVNVTWDSGSLSNEAISNVYVAILSNTNDSIPENIINSDKLTSNAVTTTKITDSNVTTAKIADSNVTSAKIADSAVTTAKINDDAVTAAKISDSVIVTNSEQSSHTPSDTTFFTTSASDGRYFRQDSTETIDSGDTWSASDSFIATTAAIDARVIDLVDDVGGFVPIANETSFPAANPDVNNGAGTIVSIASISSTRTPSSGTVTIANGQGSNTVTITGCGSTVLTAGFGVLVETTTTLNTYTFHRLVPKATEVTTVASISSDITAVANNTTDIGTVATDLSGSDNIGTVAGSISNVNLVGGSIANVNTTASNISGVNSFAERYRVVSADPTTSLDEGDLAFNTTDNNLKFYNGSSWTSIAPGIANVVDDSSPQLGGDLDVVTHSIVSTSNRDIAITPNGSGKVVIDGLSHPTADGSAGQFLKTDGSGTLSFGTVNTDVSNDTTPQLGGNLDVNGNDIVSASNGDIDIIPNGTGEVKTGGVGGLKLPSGTTAQRTTTQGHIRFNSTLDTVEFYDGHDYINLDVSPTITSVSPTVRTPAQITAGGDMTITGTNYKTGMTVTFIGNDGTTTASATVTRDSATQLTAAIPTTLATNKSPFDIKVARPSGLSATLDNQLTIDNAPAFTTAAGSLGSIYDSSRDSYSLLTAAATDADGDTITYSVSVGSLPAGLSLNTSTAAITGTATAVASDTTSTFTISAATTNSTSTRQFSITVLAPVITSITATGSGNFAIPTGLTALGSLLIVGGGGGGGSHGGGGGGAGGMINIGDYDISHYSSPIALSVGSGGGNSADGSDSNFGGLTADGGGAGGDFNQNGTAGGSGGGGGKDRNGGSSGSNQASTSNDGTNSYSGTGYGNGGGNGGPPGGGAGGGGGASNSGQNGNPGEYAGNGGNGRSSNTGGNSVTYAGGGGGGTNGGHAGSGGSGGGGGQGAVGTDGLGGGGGGAAYNGGSGYAGGNGIIIYKY